MATRRRLKPKKTDGQPVRAVPIEGVREVVTIDVAHAIWSDCSEASLEVFRGAIVRVRVPDVAPSEIAPEAVLERLAAVVAGRPRVIRESRRKVMVKDSSVPHYGNTCFHSEGQNCHVGRRVRQLVEEAIEAAKPEDEEALVQAIESCFSYAGI